MRCYRIHFKAPFHVDSEGTGFYQKSEAFIRSDTLSAAIMSAWIMLDPGAANRWKDTPPPYLISSAFPYYQNTFFLPRPHFSHHVTSVKTNQFPLFKKIKEIQWVSLDLWREIVFSKQDLMKLAEGPDFRLGGLLAGFSSDAVSEEPLWLQEERTRLAIDRSRQQSADGQLFEFSRTFFKDGGGLYFLADIEEGAIQEFETALRLLGEMGIGADRNVGNGWFQWECIHNFELEQSKPGENHQAIALSLVLPNTVDVSTDDWLEDASYDLVVRHGWIAGSGYRKKPLRMFTEGSRFMRPFAGSMEQVGPGEDKIKHSVYRDGRGFFVRAGVGS